MTENLVSLGDFEDLAKKKLPKNIWDFIDAGSFDETTPRRNRSAFDEIVLRPRFMRDVGNVDISTTVLGTPISFPVIIAPAAGHCMVHPDGELATAQGAQESNTLMIVSTLSDYPIEDIASVPMLPKWFQLYHREKKSTKNLVRRAEDLGYLGICITIDTPIASPKERDVRNRFTPPFKGGNFNDIPDNNVFEETPDWIKLDRPAFTWEDLSWIRNFTDLPLILKGIRTSEDAKICVEYGVDAIFVSNHGGRQIDSTLSSIESLIEVNETVNGKAEIYLDSGIRRGSDVLKALALGARAVAIGRPFYWGLTVNGSNGVHQVLEILRDELIKNLAYCGQKSVMNLESGILNIPSSWTSRVII